jgi:hypothetical protein
MLSFWKDFAFVIAAAAVGLAIVLCLIAWVFT